MPDDFHAFSVDLSTCNRLLKRAGLPYARAIFRIPRGEVNAVFDLALADGQRVVLKVQARGPRPHALLRECEACSLLAQSSNVPVPKFINLNTEQDIMPYCYALLTRLPGFDGDVAWHDYSTTDQRTLLHLLGQTLARIHAVDLSCHANLTALPVNRSPADWATIQRARFDAARQQHSTRGYLPPSLLADIRQFWEERAALLDDANSLCLVHGDYQLGNIKLQPPNTVACGVLDLDQADISHPEFDLAAMESSILTERPDLKEAFYHGYAGGRQLDASFHSRVALYALLRYLEVILAYQGPVRFQYGGQSSAESIARLIAPAEHCSAAHLNPPLRQLLSTPVTAWPDENFEDPPTVDSIDAKYLAHVLAKGTGRAVRVTSWHQSNDQSWQDFPGRGGDAVVSYQAAVRPEGDSARDIAFILKLTSSIQEAMFYAHLTPLLTPHVPKPYHVVLRPPPRPHWLFLEHVPCMVLGPLWKGAEFGKAIEGLVAVHARFWHRTRLLRSHAWLPRFTTTSCLRSFQLDLTALATYQRAAPIPLHLSRPIAELSTRAHPSSPIVAGLARRLAARPRVLLHGDYHLANVGTRNRSLEAPPIIADWTNCSWGPPQIDLAYFLSTLQGITREKPTRAALVETYLSCLRSAGLTLAADDTFQRALDAATLFDDVHALARLLRDPEGESAWRSGIYYSIEEETALRAERALHLLLAASPNRSG